MPTPPIYKSMMTKKGSATPTWKLFINNSLTGLCSIKMLLLNFDEKGW